MDKVETGVVKLGDENRRHTLEERGPVHVDRGADGQDEAAYVLGHAVFLLYALHHEGQSGRAGNRKQSFRPEEERGCVAASTGEPQFVDIKQAQLSKQMRV